MGRMAGGRVFVLFFIMGLLFTTTGSALEPPTREQLERYRRDGTLEQRLADALRINNHRISPHLVRQLGARFGKSLPAPFSVMGQTDKGLPATGLVRTPCRVPSVMTVRRPQS